MGFYQISKIIFKLSGFELIRTTVKIIPDPANGTGIGINGFLSLTLKFEGF